MHVDVKPKLISGFGNSAPEWGNFRSESSAVGLWVTLGGGDLARLCVPVVVRAVISVCVEQICESVSFLILEM